jgi:acetyltransferase-like isoleucine patch superfamily enzyme
MKKLKLILNFNKLLNKIRGNKISSKKNNYIIKGVNVIDNHLKISLRNPDLEKDYYLKIGNNSMISGNFIFETNTGQINIGSNTFIGGSLFICIDGIDIGDDVLISWNCTFIDNNSHSIFWDFRKNDVNDWMKGIQEKKIGFYKDWKHVNHKKIIVKDKAWIGFNCIILKGVTIGEGAIIGSGSVVTHDVPDWTIVGGNPAVVIKKISENEI